MIVGYIEFINSEDEIYPLGIRYIPCKTFVQMAYYWPYYS